jgi:hypothetical protein
MRGARRGSVPALCGLLILALAMPGFAVNPARPGAAGASSGWQVLSTRPLPEDLRIVADLRWAAADSIYLGAGRRGGFKVRFEPTWGRPEEVFSVNASKSGLWAFDHVGVSSDYIAMAPQAFTVAWRRLPAGPVRWAAFETISDIDVWQDRLVVLGARKDGRQRYAPDGAIAWTGSLSKDLSDLKAVRYSIAGPGARPMDACGPFDLGHVRFLPDGRFVVVPGVEPGVFLYDNGGKLLRTWDTGILGIDDQCQVTDAQMKELSANLNARNAWINQRRTLDDVLSLPGGPGLIVRTAGRGTTRWQVKVLHPDGTVGVSDLPFTFPTANGHLRADLRGDRIAFLVVDYQMRSSTPSRLIVTNLPASL